MKLALSTCGLLAFGLTAAFSQTPQFQDSTWLTNYPGLRYDNSAPEAPADRAAVGSASAETKHLKVNGPLAAPFKGHKALEVPKRLVQLFNPVAPIEAAPEPPRRARISPRAWTTVVGWNPGGSAFPNPETHEPQMRLVTFTRGTGQ